jgi:lysophospholipase L1-like esterase
MRCATTVSADSPTGTDMTVARRVFAAVALMGFALLASVLVAEAALRLLVPTPNVYRMLLPGTRVFEPNRDFVHGISGPAYYAVNEHGIRGRGFGPDSAEYRILLVGGSTTECTLLDDSENWGAIAERELSATRDGRRVWAGNVGRSGLTSRDHVVTIKYLTPQYPRMDLVVLLVGVNDLSAALRQGRTYRSPPPLSDPDAEGVQVRNAFALTPAGFREVLNADLVAERLPWYKRLHLYKLAKRARTALQAREVVRSMAGNLFGQWRDHRRRASRILDTLPDLTRPLADYRQHLEAIVLETRRAGAEPLFLTQPALWKVGITPAEEQLLWLGGTGRFQEEPGHEYYSPAALARAMAQYNEVMLKVCRENQLSCLDLASRVPRDTSMFYDDVHFTEQGSAFVGRQLAAHLRAVKPDLFEARTRSDPASSQ